MAVATITKKDDGYHVVAHISGQRHTLRICPKYITAAQIKRNVDTGQYALPTPYRHYEPPGEEVTHTKVGFKDELLAWLKEHPTMWMTSEIAAQHRYASRTVIDTLRHLLKDDAICRSATQSRYHYGARGIVPVAKDFGQAMVEVLKKHPQGLAQFEMYRLTGCHVPLNGRTILDELIKSGVVKAVPGRRPNTKSRSVGIMYEYSGTA